MVVPKNRLLPDRARSLRVGTDLIDPTTFFRKAVDRTTDIHNNSNRRHELSMAVMLAVRAIKSAVNDKRLTAAWLDPLQLPALTMPARTQHTEITRRLALHWTATHHNWWR